MYVQNGECFQSFICLRYSFLELQFQFLYICQLRRIRLGEIYIDFQLLRNYRFVIIFICNNGSVENFYYQWLLL